MDVRGMHSASQFAILAIAAAPYAWKLPRRDGFTARLCAVAIITARWGERGRLPHPTQAGAPAGESDGGAVDAMRSRSWEGDGKIAYV